jgi:hypothetical protein
MLWTEDPDPYQTLCYGRKMRREGCTAVKLTSIYTESLTFRFLYYVDPDPTREVLNGLQKLKYNKFKVLNIRMFYIESYKLLQKSFTQDLCIYGFRHWQNSFYQKNLTYF